MITDHFFWRLASFCEVRPHSVRSGLNLWGRRQSVRPHLNLWNQTSFCDARLHSMIPGHILWSQASFFEACLILWGHNSFCEAILHSVRPGLILWGQCQSVRLVSPQAHAVGLMIPKNCRRFSNFRPCKSGLASECCSRVHAFYFSLVITRPIPPWRKNMSILHLFRSWSRFKGKNVKEKNPKMILYSDISCTLVGDTWRIWSNINTIGVHFSTTKK